MQCIPGFGFRNALCVRLASVVSVGEIYERRKKETLEPSLSSGAVSSFETTGDKVFARCYVTTVQSPFMAFTEKRRDE